MAKERAAKRGIHEKVRVLLELDQILGNVEKRRLGGPIEVIQIDVVPRIADVLQTMRLGGGHEFREIERLVLGFEIPFGALTTHAVPSAREITAWIVIDPDETVTIRGLQGDLKPRQKLMAEIVSADGSLQRVSLLCRIDTLDELEYYRNGGILHYVLRKLAA